MSLKEEKKVQGQDVNDAMLASGNLSDLDVVIRPTTTSIDSDALGHKGKEKEGIDPGRLVDKFIYL